MKSINRNGGGRMEETVGGKGRRGKEGRRKEEEERNYGYFCVQ